MGCFTVATVDAILVYVRVFLCYEIAHAIATTNQAFLVKEYYSLMYEMRLKRF